MKYLHFIVNPISGKGHNTLEQTELLYHFPSDQYRINVSYTESKGHAKEIALNAIDEGVNCLVACGGDGTVNEVASAIVGTRVHLGIIPMGSGNGLATNLGIKGSLTQMLTKLKAMEAFEIDCGQINGQYFFSNTGLGIDAEIIKKYELGGSRKLWSYISAALKAALSYRYYRTIVRIDDKESETTPLMLFVSNSNEMGYGMSLTPQAKLNDGYLDLVVVPKLSFLQKLLLGLHVLNRSFPKFGKAKSLLMQSLFIHQPERIFTDVQIDGEYHNLKTNEIHIRILPAALKVVV